MIKKNVIKKNLINGLFWLITVDSSQGSIINKDQNGYYSDLCTKNITLTTCCTFKLNHTDESVGL